MSLSPKLEQTLRAIHTGIETNGAYYGNAKHPMIAVLAKEGHVSIDTTRTDPNDSARSSIAVTLSGHYALGINPVIATTEEKVTHLDNVATTTEAPAKAKRTRSNIVPEVQLASGFMALPEATSRRGGSRQEVYAFGQLSAPQNGQYHSFFVPATAENPDAEKTVRAAVSSANIRYKDKEISFTHRFVTENGVAGVRVFRVK